MILKKKRQKLCIYFTPTDVWSWSWAGLVYLPVTRSLKCVQKVLLLCPLCYSLFCLFLLCSISIFSHIRYESVQGQKNCREKTSSMYSTHLLLLWCMIFVCVQAVTGKSTLVFFIFLNGHYIQILHVTHLKILWHPLVYPSVCPTQIHKDINLTIISVYI